MKNIFKDYDKLNSTDIKILQYIIKNAATMKNITAEELSKKLYVSKTTIINLAKKLGYDGYSELKYHLKEFLETENKIDIEDSGIKNFGNNIFEEISNEVNRTLKIQDRKEIEDTVEKILKSKVMYVVSRGSSSHFGEHLSSRLAICKIKSIFIRDTNLLDIIIEHMTSEEILILLSQSGNTKIIVDIAAKANIMGLKTVGITSFGKNELQKYCTKNLYFYANETDTKHHDAVSRVGMNVVVQLLIEYIKKEVTKNG